MSEKRQIRASRPATIVLVIDDFERCYRFMRSRDPRYDGFFFVGVLSTGIYCRPSCPARLPQRRNVRLFATAAAAQAAGLRACKRCEPDAAPGSPAWNRRADVAGRAVRLIAEGVVDREGVPGLAGRLGFSERQLNRILVAEVGAGPAQLARAQRAQAARTLIESTGLRLAEVALAAGFGSVRQFNDTINAIYARTPSELRRRARRRHGAPTPGAVELRLSARAPFDGAGLLDFLAARAVPGVELVADGTYSRTLALEHGGGRVSLTPEQANVRCVLQLDDLRDLTAAVARCRRLLDLDADPVSISAQLVADPVLGELARRRPGLRVPGCVDGFELAVRAIVGQQVSVPAARTVLGRLAERWGDPLPEPAGGLTRRFPDAATVARLDPAELPMPRQPRRGAGRAGPAGRRRRVAPRRGRRLHGRARRAARRAGRGPLDRLLRGHARARRPGRVPARRRGHPPCAGAARRGRRTPRAWPRSRRRGAPGAPTRSCTSGAAWASR